MRLTPTGLRVGNRILPVEIGRGGLRHDKREGDGATPIGRLRILEMLWRADRLPRPAAWARPIGPRDLWCDASDHPSYNQLVRAHSTPATKPCAAPTRSMTSSSSPTGTTQRRRPAKARLSSCISAAVRAIQLRAASPSSARICSGSPNTWNPAPRFISHRSPAFSWRKIPRGCRWFSHWFEKPMATGSAPGPAA